MITTQDYQEGKRRTLIFTLVVALCIGLVGAAGFLLIIALEKTYHGDLSALFAERPRAAILMGIAFGIIALVLLAVLIRGIIALFKVMRVAAKKRKAFVRARREAKEIAISEGKKFSKKEFKAEYIEKMAKRDEFAMEGYEEGGKKGRRAIVVANGESIGAAPSSSPSAAKPSAKGARRRFPTLSAFDEAHPSFESVVPDDGLTLPGVVDAFRQYAAGTKGLYYSRADVMAFISSLSCSHTMILQGMSGTGKTSLPVCFGEFLASPTDVIPVQPTWKERSDVLGYYNEFTGAYAESDLLKSLYSAGGTDAVRLVVLDEANIARVEYYFAEFLSLLELPDPSRRRLSAAPSGMPLDPRRMEGGSILLPENVWFILTANNDDSTFAFSDKVYDRASVIDLDSRAEPFDAAPRPGLRVGAPALESLFADARARYAVTPRDLRKVAELDRALRSLFGISFGNRVMLQLRRYVPTYVACGGEATEALDQLLSRKVLRKLSAANPVVVRARGGELLSLLSALFGEGGAPLCEAAVRKYCDN